MSRDLERAALALAVNCGYRVLPTDQEKKKPLEGGWQRRATTDPERVAEWWAKYPEANPGVATGRGLLVVDADTQEAVSRLRELGIPEETPTVKTPRGGLHFYLRRNAPTRTDFLTNVELRGRGGLAVGAGSRRGERVYEWAVAPWEADEAPIPGELERLIREIEKKAKKDKRSAGQIVTEGGRNHYLTQAVGRCSAQG
jgi:Bifunctional DNA primase/polymerase, N-terminal